MTNYLHLLPGAKLRSVYDEFPWLEEVVKTHGFESSKGHLVTSCRVERVDEGLISRSPKEIWAHDEGVAHQWSEPERLLIVDARGALLVQVGVDPFISPARWYRPWQKSGTRFIKTESVEGALNRIGSGAASRARFIVSLTPVQLADGMDGSVEFAQEIIVSKMR